MMAAFSKKPFLPWLVVGAVLLAVVPGIAHAQQDSGGYCPTGAFTLGKLPGCAVYLLTYVVNTVLSLFVMFGGWLVGKALVFNSHIVDSPAVRIGSSVTLSVANLGFVLMLIVIAIATILRNASYGMKQLLVRLIGAAIAVNFSIVIAALIINFSNGLTDYFVTQATGGIGTDKSVGYFEFVNRISGSMSPSLLLTPPKNTAEINKELAASGAVSNVVSGAGFVADSIFGNLMRALLAMVFTIVFTFLIAITLLALAVLLMARYVYLTFLLILFPLVWLFYVVPIFKKYWTQWWDAFMKWIFFAPASVFFLYLAVTIASYQKEYMEGISSAKGDNAQAGLGMVMNQSEGFMTASARMIVVIAIAFGGIFAANKMGIAGAGIAMGAAKTTGKWAKGKAIDYSKRAALRGAGYGMSMGNLKKDEDGSMTTRAQRWSNAALKKGGLTGRLMGVAASGVAKLERASGSDQVKDAGKRMKLGDKSDNEIRAGFAKLLSKNSAEGLAYKGEMLKRDMIKELKPEDVISKKQEELAAKYGMTKQHKEIEKEMKMNTASFEALQAARALMMQNPNMSPEEQWKKLNEAHDTASKTANAARDAQLAVIDEQIKRKGKEIDDVKTSKSSGFTAEEKAEVVARLKGELKQLEEGKKALPKDADIQREVYKKIGGTSEEGEKLADAFGKFHSEMTGWLGKLKSGDGAAMNLEAAMTAIGKEKGAYGMGYEELKRFVKMFSVAVADSNYTLVNSMTSKMGSRNRNEFGVNYWDPGVDVVGNMRGWGPKEITEVKNRVKNTLEGDILAALQSNQAPSGGAAPAAGAPPATKS